LLSLVPENLGRLDIAVSDDLRDKVLGGRAEQDIGVSLLDGLLGCREAPAKLLGKIETVEHSGTGEARHERIVTLATTLGATTLSLRTRRS
jgi:hypothetical protein